MHHRHPVSASAPDIQIAWTVFSRPIFFFLGAIPVEFVTHESVMSHVNLSCHV